MFARFNEHGEQLISDPRYKYFGGSGYKEGQAAVFEFNSIVDRIYHQVGTFQLNACSSPSSLPCSANGANGQREGNLTAHGTRAVHRTHRDIGLTSKINVSRFFKVWNGRNGRCYT